MGVLDWMGGGQHVLVQSRNLKEEISKKFNTKQISTPSTLNMPTQKGLASKQAKKQCKCKFFFVLH
jgi:hypothetical protein